MAFYDYKCENEECEEFDVKKTCQMAMSEYSEEKLPKCECCGEPTKRMFNFNGYVQSETGMGKKNWK